MTVLIVEDDSIILEGLRFALEQERYTVLTASRMADALEIIEREQIDIYLLDVMLPDGDGYQICSKIRAGFGNRNAPVLFLTACDDEVSTVRALEQGADDYIAKPFRIRELLARMKAILRRSAGERLQGQRSEEAALVGRNQVHLRTGWVYRDGEEIILTAMEYKLLLIFLNHRGQTLSRKQILDQIWDAEGDFVNDNTLSVYIRRLRKKLDDTPEGQMIGTVRGLGYRMEVCEPFAIPLELKEISLELQAEPGIRLVCDVHWTVEALSNIVKNCLEHTPAGGKIVLVLSQNNFYTGICIQDNGDGISKEDLPHIFERFYKGKKDSKDSVGIGLALAQKIILLQNGDISVESRPQKGTSFYIKLYR